MAHPLKQIDRIKFGILSPDEIRKLSVTRIITADTYDEDGLPIDSGLMDGRLGTIEPGQRCKTCGNRVGECPGHFGHIELARPVIHVGFAPTIQKILRAICRKCSRLIIPEDEVIDLQSTRDMDASEVAEKDEIIETLKKAAKLTECPFCGEKQIKIKLEKPTTFYEKTDAGTNRLNPSEIRDRFERISDDDCLALGINPEVARPEWMILTVLPIPPVCVRPSITLDSGVRSEDDMTHKLVDIIRINQRLRENIEAGAPQLIVEDLWELLQYHVTTYFNNEVSGIPPARHRSGRALRTLAQRLKGKEGRFRSNLSGKRVDFSARTVISPDPNLSINEVGVPFDIAKILTIPERLTEWNIDEMRRLVINGPDIHPGANYVIRLDGRRIDLRFVKNREAVADTLEPGFVIERHLKDRDIVLFNRQPSLHRLSIMAHEVLVMPFKTFRLSLCVCLSGETKVTTDLGMVKISKLVKNWSNFSPLSCSWNNGQNVYFSGISKPHMINPLTYNLKSYRITTKRQRTIEATSEHPFYTNRGIIKCGALKIGDSLAVYPIEYPEIESFEKDEYSAILTSEQITTAIPDGTYESYTFQELERMEFINIQRGTKKEIEIASLVGHIFGDGSLLITPEGGRVIFRAAEVIDINSIWDIVKSLNLEPTSIQLTESKEFPVIEVGGKVRKVKGKTHLFEIRRKPVAIAFKSLGVPVGDRITQEYRVPKWILEGSTMVKRAFLRSYFGAEMSTPRLHTSSNKKFNQPLFKIAKIEGLSAEPFINDIKHLLKSFNVEISSVVKNEGNIRKDGTQTIIYSVNFKADDENLHFLFNYIGYEFAYEKEKLARLAAEYNMKKILAKVRATAQLQNAYELREQGLSYPEIAKRIGHKSWSTIASWLYHSREWAGLPADFPDFPSWQKKVTKNLNNGLVWDEIYKIEEINLPIAYDITTVDENHNFIANEFLVKNCPPYNADFDGDEMNLHVPQSEEAQAEARILMRVQEQILTPRYGGPIIGGIQDYISAAFILTRKSSLYTRDEVGNLLMAAGYIDPDNPKDRYEIPPPAIQYPQELWTGKQIITVLLPAGINLSLKAKVCRRCDSCKKEECPYDGYVLIRNGQLLTGIIDKKAIGAGQPESVLHRIVKDYSTKKGRQFLDSVARMLIEVITHIGFTIGLDDVEIQEEADARIDYILSNAGDMVNKLIEVYKRGELQRLPGRTLIETLEMKIMGVLSEARDEAGRVAGEYLGIDKHIVIMTKTGARGNPLNLAQMAACVGQQSVRGERIVRGYRQRTLPHFQRGDLSAPARGFVNSSYYKGLLPIEFFFHAMGGREGLVDTAVRTSTSGYMQRRLINALQDIKVEYDGTVRNAVGSIIQFKYGEDRIDPAKSDHGKAVNTDVLIEKVITETEFKGPAINYEVPGVKNRIEELLNTDQLPKSIIDKIIFKVDNLQLDKSQFDAFIKETLRSYHRALIEPGEAVGIVAAQSIGEPGTQMTLKTFHYAGAAEFNVTLGLPRLIEIVDARRNPSTPTMTVYLEQDIEDEKEMEERAREIARLLELTKVENIATSVDIDLATMNIVITLDQDLMKDKKIELDLIKKQIEFQLKAFKKEDIKGSKNSVILDPKTDDLDKIQKLLEKIRELPIKGLKGINRVIIRQDEETNEFIIYTDGTNFKEALLIPGVDSKRTITNHIREVESTLGIEACRTSLIRESNNVLEEQGLDVDIRHIMLVADLMTYSGSIRQIGRHGISGQKSSVLARAAFEVTIKHLLEASIRGDEDPLRGITENVIIGQVIPLGTGGIDLLIKPQRRSSA